MKFHENPTIFRKRFSENFHINEISWKSDQWEDELFHAFRNFANELKKQER